MSGAPNLVMAAPRQRSWRGVGLAAALAGLPVAAMAQAVEPASPAVTARWLLTDDSDDFREVRASVGYQGANGWGLSASRAQYRAPQWSASGTGLAATYLRQSDQRTVDAALGVTRTEGHDALTGRLDYLEQITASTALGVSGERDVVNSIRGIEEGITHTTLLGVLDHQFTSRFSVGASAGNTWFSDDNQRRIVRTRWNFELIPDSGFNTYLKTRNYRNTRPYQGNYYAPERLREMSVGLSWRTAISDSVVFFVGGDGGRQRIDGESDGIWNALIGLQSRRNARVQWRVALESSNNAASMFNQSAGSYRYLSLSGYLVVPFH